MKSETTIKDIAQTTTGVKPSAIWARVSTQDQRETSIPSQIDRAKNELEQKGYTVNHILRADWTSLDLFSCPEFQKLQTLIKNREIDALGILDRDRLEAKGLQRLIFLSECREAGVELVICQGPPILDEPEGQLVELALAIGKERQVMRARQGAIDGMHHRVMKRRLPVARHKLYGYKWEDEQRLVPDENWAAIKLIFDMLLEGSSYVPILQELKKRGIPSPSGQPEWNKTALSVFIHNPTYAGRYYALKGKAVPPARRNGNTYGNSSRRTLALDEAYYIPEIEIVDPPITWEQRLRILEQLAKHQRLAQRNAKNDYLLRGLVFCETHRGKGGEMRRYHGNPKHDTWYYRCPVGGCAAPYIKGWHLDGDVRSCVRRVLDQTPDSYFEKMRKEIYNPELRKQLEQELSNLQKKREKSIRNEAMLEDRHINGQISQASYGILKEKYQKEREWLKKEQETKLDELAQLGREAEAIASIEQIRKEADVELDDFTTEEWRELLNKLNVNVVFKVDGTMSIEVGIPYLPLPEGATPRLPQAESIASLQPRSDKWPQNLRAW